MELLLIRHGKSIQGGGGHADIPLSDKGRKQAAKLAEYLASNKRIARLYSSPLVRALETAKSVGEAQGVAPIAMPELKERSHGIFDGLLELDAIARYPEQWKLLRDKPHEAAPDGESFADVRDRVRAALERIVDPASDETIAVVTHGEWLNICLCTLLGVRSRSYPIFHFRNTSVTSVEVTTEHKLKINYVNRADHLAKKKRRNEEQR